MNDPLNLANYSGLKKVPTLPRLPIPSLRSTLDKYLKSIEPFLLEDVTKGGLPFNEALQKRVIWAEEFEKDLGQVCQRRLVGLSMNIILSGILLTVIIFSYLRDATPNHREQLHLLRLYLYVRSRTNSFPR